VISNTSPLSSWEIEAPAVVIVEAKKAGFEYRHWQCNCRDGSSSQRFNRQQSANLVIIYGCSSGTTMEILQPEKQTVTIDLTDYPPPPVEQILAMLVDGAGG
jgi:hypothetical protein